VTGKYEQPDTLDLADVASWAVRGAEGMSDPDAMDEQYWLGGFDKDGPCMLHDVNDWCESKWLGPLALLRQLSGQGDMNSDANRMARLREMAHPDGGFYENVETRPWAKDFGFGGDTYAADTGKRYIMAGMNGRYSEAALMYWKLTGDDTWRDLATKAIHKCGDLMTVRNRANLGEEYAYFKQSSVFPEGVGDQADAPEPPRELNHCGVWTGQGALSLYSMTGDERDLEISILLARYLLKHSHLVENDGDFGVSHYVEGVPLVHFQLNALVRCFLLDLGLEINDPCMIQAGETGWYYGCRNGETMGFFPEYIRYGLKDDPADSTCETCCIADMIHLGLLLSKSGRKDCWDDLDRWARNMFTQGQLRNNEWMYSFWHQHAAGKPSRFDTTKYKTHEHVQTRLEGAWGGWLSPNQTKSADHGPQFACVMNCCTGNAMAQLYRLWRDMATFDHQSNTLQVNLLLNKTLPEADIQSHLPHQGIVRVIARRDMTVTIRHPEWATPDQCSVMIKEQPKTGLWEGKYLKIDIQQGQHVEVHFPVETHKKTLNIMNQDWPVVIRGNTIVDIEPRGRFGSIHHRVDGFTHKTSMISRQPRPQVDPIAW